MFDWMMSDWHLGETRLEIMQRPYADPEAMFAEFMANHNAVIKPTDRVLFVGDAVSKSAEKPMYWLSQIERLNGVKTIIRGNHDVPFTTGELETVFDKVVPDGDGIEFEVKSDAVQGAERTIPCYATHYPTTGRHDRFNIVGHIHSAWKYQKNMLNVSVDVHHFHPVPISKIGFYLTAIESFYDEDVWCADNRINAVYNATRGKKGTYFQTQAAK